MYSTIVFITSQMFTWLASYPYMKDRSTTPYVPLI